MGEKGLDRERCTLRSCYIFIYTSPDIDFATATCSSSYSCNPPFSPEPQRLGAEASCARCHEAIIGSSSCISVSRSLEIQREILSVERWSCITDSSIN